MWQIFCCSIIQGVSFNYHQRNVRSRSRTSRSRSWLLWQNLSLVSKYEPGLSLRGYGLDYITDISTSKNIMSGCKAESFPHSKFLKATQLTEIMTNNSISKVSRNSFLFFTHTYDRLYILYINFPQVFLRIAKLCKQTTATIVANVEFSFKFNSFFKQWNLFLNIPKLFSMVHLFWNEICCAFFCRWWKISQMSQKMG